MPKNKFQFKHHEVPEWVYTAKLSNRGHNYIVMWVEENKPDMVEYGVDVVEEYIRLGVWVIAE